MVVCVNILDEKTKHVLIDKIIIKWNQTKSWCMILVFEYNSVSGVIIVKYNNRNRLIITVVCLA